MSTFAELVGKTLTAVRQIGDDVIDFECDDGALYRLYHSQFCCESVVVDDVSGDWADLLGVPVLVAEERSSSADEGDPTPPDVPTDAARGSESNTWTFYTLRTIKGTVDVRWHGSSNGYYSESVDFQRVNGPMTEGVE